MRALFYSAARHWSGSARAFAATATGLIERGYQVTYVCRADGVVERRLTAAGGYEIVPLLMGGPWVNVSLRLRQVLLDHFVEVVFVHTPREQLVASLAIKLAERGALIRRVPAGGRFVYAMEAKIADRLAATGYLFTTGADVAKPLPADALEPVNADLGVAVDALDTVRPASRATIGMPPNTRLLICVLDPGTKKKVAVVLRAVALLAPRHPDLRLVLAGTGAEDDDLRMHAAALGITEIVAHAGDRDDHQALLRSADIGCVVADQDDAAYGFLDLQALRVPVVSERTPLAQRYVADGITGVLLTQFEPPVMAARIALLLAHDDRRAAMGSAGRARVARDFTEQAMVDGFERSTQIARDRSRWRD